MEIISAFFKGIIYSISLLSPVSYSGFESLFRFTGMNLTKGGYDSILPLVIHFACLIGLCCFLRRDLKTVFTTAGSLLKNIKAEKIDLNTDEPKKKLLYMIFFGSLTLILSPVISLLTVRISGNLVVTSAGFLISALFIILAGRVKERSLKESNHTIFNAIPVAAFFLLGMIPGVSGIAAMYFAGCRNGFKKDFTLKYISYIILSWIFFSFLIKLIKVFTGGIICHFGVLYYIFAFLGALGASGFALYLFGLAGKNKKMGYYAIVNAVIAVIAFVIWIRG